MIVTWYYELSFFVCCDVASQSSQDVMACHWNLFLRLDLAAIWQKFASGLPVAIFCHINATQYKTHKFLRGCVQWLATGKQLPVASHCTATCGICCQILDFVAKCQNFCHLRNLLPVFEKKTVQVPFPHPTLTSKTHTINNTMTNYSTSAATTANAAANAARGTTTNNDKDVNGNEDGLEDKSEDEASDDDKETEDALFCAARGIQNRMSHCIGMAGMEDHHLCIFFGTNMSIVSTVWDMLVANGLRPKKSRPKHLLWAIYFLKNYPKQSLGCLVVSASTGAANPKTMRKWVWQFIENIADLADKVVSLFVTSRSHVAHCHLMPPLLDISSHLGKRSYLPRE
jgi:hypothetical protein